MNVVVHMYTKGKVKVERVMQDASASSIPLRAKSCILYLCMYVCTYFPSPTSKSRSEGQRKIYFEISAQDLITLTLISWTGTETPVNSGF
jgi:hypothetical protein